LGKIAKKNYITEQITIKLREIEAVCGQGKTIAEVAKQAEITAPFRAPQIPRFAP